MDAMLFLQLIPRIRVYEKKLLDRAKIERMVDADSPKDALKVLQETDYASFMSEVKRPEDYEILLSKELIRLYEMMYEACPVKELIDVMALKYDYHNIKVLIKGKILNQDFSQMLIPVGMMNIEMLRISIQNDNYDILPKFMEKAVKAIFENYEETKDPQQIDIIADKFLYAQINEIASSKKVKDKALDRYLTNVIDLNNIKTLLRVKKQGKSVTFFLNCIVPGGSIEVSRFREMFHDTIENISNYLVKQEYISIVKEGITSYVLTNSVSLFEKLIDNHLMNIMKEAKMITKGVEPVLTYIYVKENEIKQIRTIMVGKLNNIAKEVIRERLRDGYV